MLHEKRVWSLSRVESVERLAFMLTQETMVLCSAFWVAGHPDYLFLNDATSVNSASEYAVVKRDGDTFMQLESITFSWCSEAEGVQYISEILAGDDDVSEFVQVVSPVIETPDVHGFCHHCR